MLRNAGGDDAQKEDADAALLRTHLMSHPSDVNAIIDDAESRVSALFDQTLLNMRLPAAQRQPIAIDKASSPSAALFRAMTANPQQILDKYSRDQTQLRLIGVRALIHRYRWNHNMLPSGLAELHAPNLVKDSFAGSEIVYTRNGDHYSLTTR